MNNEIFIEITIVFLKKAIETVQPWLQTSPLSFIEIFYYGLKTIFYVFSFTDLDTKTSVEIVNTLEQCIVHFLQFIKQITEEENLFLQLTPKDASFFVYKKMIFPLKLESKNLHPTKELYNKMMIFFSTLHENRYLESGKVHEENWWKTDFLNYWISHMNSIT